LFENEGGIALITIELKGTLLSIRLPRPAKTISQAIFTKIPQWKLSEKKCGSCD
jgi:hypothetical protein